MVARAVRSSATADLPGVGAGRPFGKHQGAGRVNFRKDTSEQHNEIFHPPLVSLPSGPSAGADRCSFCGGPAPGRAEGQVVHPRLHHAASRHPVRRERFSTNGADADGVVVFKLLRKQELKFAEVTAVETVQVRKRVFLTLCAGDDFLIISNAYANFPSWSRRFSPGCRRRPSPRKPGRWRLLRR
jgi:hypothetical protein